MERSWPTASGVSVPGKATESRSGSTGSVDGISGRAHRDLLAAGARGGDLDHRVTVRSPDRDGAAARRRDERQLDDQEALLVGRRRGLGVHLRPEGDDAAERPVLHLDLLVEALLAALRRAPVAREDELAAADLQLDVDAGTPASSARTTARGGSPV